MKVWYQPLRGHVLTDILENLPSAFYDFSHNIHRNMCDICLKV